MLFAVVHRLHALAIKRARVAVGCELPVNSAIARAVNTLGDLHGGADEQPIELIHHMQERRRHINKIILHVAAGKKTKCEAYRLGNNDLNSWRIGSIM